ncbi:N-acyl homoserine lactonase family protein [Paraburkholderia phymatum]|uniref:N-acyl homoserine lactonase family protein n=1 Tax=Paraburkholderia phymatum TaxID=148447 RepID=UPI00316F8EFE
MSDVAYKIDAVQLGKRIADTSMFLYLTDPGVPLAIAYRLWLLRSPARTIVVDTGPPIAEGRERHLTETRDLREALAVHDVDPRDIDTVLLTHLHWDHAANADQFPNARFYAQRDEIAFLRDGRHQHPAFDRFFSTHAHLEQLVDDGRLVPLDGDIEIARGVQAIRVGGHTPGSQMFCVDIAEGRALLTGDAVPLNRNYVERIPSGILVNVFEAIAALDKAHALSPIRLYTGHDLAPYLDLAN